METQDATHVQQLIQDTLRAAKRSRGSSPPTGGSGSKRKDRAAGRPTLSAPDAAETNTGVTEKNPPSKMNHYQDWSENVTDLVATNTPETAVATSKTYSLDDIQLFWQEYLTVKARCDEDTKWLEEAKIQLDRISGGADIFKLHGHEVATYKRVGNLNLKRLGSEHPEMIAKYTRIVAKQQFDKEAFEQEEPELYTAYRAKVFRASTATTLVNFK